jgi:cob(I)alamin adenosyltransferase
MTVENESSTNLINEKGIFKDDIRIEAIGSIDEASAALGFARAIASNVRNKEYIKIIQKTLYMLMANLAGAGGTRDSSNEFDQSKVEWLQDQIKFYNGLITVPDHFILSGDTIAGGALSVARTSIRRAERRVVALQNNGIDINPILVNYLNRLSYFCFLMELLELPQIP